MLNIIMIPFISAYKHVSIFEETKNNINLWTDIFLIYSPYVKNLEILI
jgi:hypothetical protein